MINFLLTSFFIHAALIVLTAYSGASKSESNLYKVEIDYSKKPSADQKPLLPDTTGKYAKPGSGDKESKNDDKIDLTDYTNKVKVIIDPLWVERSASFTQKYKVIMRITLTKTGKIRNVYVSESSGYYDIDRAAYYMFKEVEKLPQPPEIVALKGIEWELTNY